MREVRLRAEFPFAASGTALPCGVVVSLRPTSIVLEGGFGDFWADVVREDRAYVVFVLGGAVVGIDAFANRGVGPFPGLVTINVVANGREVRFVFVPIKSRE